MLCESIMDDIRNEQRADYMAQIEWMTISAICLLTGGDMTIPSWISIIDGKKEEQEQKSGVELKNELLNKWGRR